MPVDKTYNPFEKYGVKRVINAATSLTYLGGSIPPREIFDSMAKAASCFVRIPELQRAAGDAIAKATGAEAGLPTAGALAGLVLAAAACMMKGTELEDFDPLGDEAGWRHIVSRLPLNTNGLRTEFIVQRSNRNSYDYSVELAGGRFREVGSTESCTMEELESAFYTTRTAAYYFTARELRKGLPLRTIVDVAHRRNVPVIVDAAAEIPPKRKLKFYIEEGADLVVYSGGKHLSGPNNSGLLVGKKDLIKLAHLQSYPFNGIGRASKMSRETIVGLVEALKIYLEHDEKAEFRKWLRWAEWFKEQLGEIKGVESGIIYQRTVEDGEPTAPFCYLILDQAKTGISGRELVNRLKSGDPCVYTLYEPKFLLGDCSNMVVINPQYLIDGEHQILLDNIKEILIN